MTKKQKKQKSLITTMLFKWKESNWGNTFTFFSHMVSSTYFCFAFASATEEGTWQSASAFRATSTRDACVRSSQDSLSLIHCKVQRDISKYGMMLKRHRWSYIVNPSEWFSFCFWEANQKHIGCMKHEFALSATDKRVATTFYKEVVTGMKFWAVSLIDGE